MYILILSVAFGHMVTCKAVPKGHEHDGLSFSLPAGERYPYEPCVPGWKTENSPSWGTLTLASKAACEAAGKAWLLQHAGDSGTRASYSCTEDK
jgi:hypothetical protein